MSDITETLGRMEQGDPAASEQLLPLLYDELRKLAAIRMANESPDNSLSATALVHEAYLRLVGADPSSQPEWNGRGHFFAAAAEAMRRILVESARSKHRRKRGGGWKRVAMSNDLQDGGADPDPDLILDVNGLLDELVAHDPTGGAVLKLRFFAGLTWDEIADTCSISRATAINHWSYARAWIRVRLPTLDSE